MATVVKSSEFSPPGMAKIAGASFIGTAVEWYDFFVYGNAAALIFGAKFFPSLSPLAGALAAFSTFTVGFLARPIGRSGASSIWLPGREIADGFVVCPLDEVGRCELLDSLCVSTPPCLVEQFSPLAVAAAVEERSIVLQDAKRGLRHDLVGSF